ncbi:hypothetical protein PAPYR_9999 [Paratrimastix pyriformis]|uniref:Uncharacterized protein n=1 Tax=Paratrimastix pyriformis TaxID=342808 RepID=A0ABQ8U6X2_9EUKA|nr:hypothetical protein PAPYR_9999 [Paratrimastix pyriformis]
MAAHTGERLPKFVEENLLGLLDSKSDSCVHLHDSPLITTPRDVTGEHMTTSVILISPQIRDLFAFVSDREFPLLGTAARVPKPMSPRAS